MTYPWLQGVDREFSDRFETGRLAHALLLSGPAGTGKLSLASQWIAGLLCMEEQNPACGHCRSCQLLESGAHPDYRLLGIEVNEKSGKLRTEIVIDQVRALVAFLQLTTTISSRKVALIHPAEALNHHAANALLKTLEEPPGEAVILLVSDHAASLPATIRSRCQRLVVRPPDQLQVLDWLIQEHRADPETAQLAVEAAAGSPLHALGMLEEETSLEAYQTVLRTLRQIKDAAVTPAVGTLSELEPEQVWKWLSLTAASAVKKNLARPPLAERFSQLQSEADRNRLLMATPVRKDFLLHDWLIQWARTIS